LAGDGALNDFCNVSVTSAHTGQKPLARTDFPPKLVFFLAAGRASFAGLINPCDYV
jgi:hypothetical protein